MPRPIRVARGAFILGTSLLLFSTARTVLAVRLLEGQWPTLVPWLVAVCTFSATAWALARALSASRAPSRRSRGLPAMLAASATAMFVLAIPAGEGPDELAHLQYTRYVAVTGRLPAGVPPPGDPWRADSYEWVQHPTYYVVTGTLARVLGLAGEAPVLAPNPASRLHGGHHVAIHAHSPTEATQPAIRLIWVLRALHMGLAALTAWWVGVALHLVGLSARGVLLGSATMGLVPQVAALMGYHSTDGAATAAAAFAVAAILRAAGAARLGAVLLAGASTGLALAVKLSTGYLLPMLALSAMQGRDTAWRSRAARATAAAFGVCLTFAWVPVREWLVLGDPLGRSFRVALLAAAGLGPTPSPGLLDPAMLSIWRVQVFEAFWARFGSLGAGPMADSHLWSLYAAASVVSAIGCGVSLLMVLTSPRRHRLLLSVVAGALAACTLWVYVTTVPRPYMAIHWTPRYIQPALPVLITAATMGLAHLARQARAPGEALRSLAAIVVPIGAAAALATARTVLLQYVGGY